MRPLLAAIAALVSIVAAPMAAQPAFADVNGVTIEPNVRLYSDVLRGDLTATGGFSGGFQTVFSTDHWVNREVPDQEPGIGTSVSSATLPMPADATIKRAFLFTTGTEWEGRAAGPSITLASPDSTVTGYTAPESSYVFVGGNTVITERVFDVTAQAAAAGAGEFTVSGTGILSWYLVASFESPTADWRRVVIDVPARWVSLDKIAVTISDLVTPSSGTVKAALGVGALWGSAPNGHNGLNVCVAPETGDCPEGSFSVADKLTGRSTDNPYGTIVQTPKQTDLYSTSEQTIRDVFGIETDVAQIDIDGVLAPGSTAVRLEVDGTVAPGGDNAVIVYTTMSIAVKAPDFAPSSLSIAKVSSGAGLHAGDTVEVTAKVADVAEGDVSANTMATVTLPAGLSFVAGTASVSSGSNAGAKTDASGDDQVDASGQTLSWRVGNGADGTHGGTVEAGSEHILTFRATAGTAGVHTATMTLAGDGPLTELHLTAERSASVTATHMPTIGGSSNPTAAALSTDAGTSVSFAVEVADPDSSTFAVSIVTPAAHGSATLQTAPTALSTGHTIVYTPSTGFSGSDSFTYQVDDGTGGVVQHLVNVEVRPAAVTPISLPETGSTIAPTLAAAALALLIGFSLRTLGRRRRSA
jgi:LPXTG-motif cell wall-anchored protein